MKKIPKCSAFDRWSSLPQNLISPIPFLLNQQKLLGDIYSFPMGFADGIVLSKPEYAKHILQKYHKNYYKSKIQSELLAEFIGNGLLTSNGDYWLKQRRLIQPGFHRKKLNAITNLMVDEIERFITKLQNMTSQKDTINIHPLMTEITFNIIAKSIFSERLANEDFEQLRNTVDCIQDYFIKCLRLPFLRWFFNLSGIHKKKMNIIEKSNKIITNEIEKRKTENIEKEDLLDMLINSKYQETNEGMSTEQIMDEVNIIFSAGHETSANALSWCFYLLTKNKTIFEKVRNESFEILNNIDENKPTFEKANQLKYTKQVINEVMRMYPPVWIIDRRTIEEDEIDGYKIPKNHIVFAHVYSLHYDKRFWNNPEEFNPDRFNENNRKEINNFQFFPFGSGPRMCVGNNFAMMEMQLVVAMLAQKFDFNYKENKQPEIKALITLQPRYGINLEIVKC